MKFTTMSKSLFFVKIGALLLLLAAAGIGLALHAFKNYLHEPMSVQEPVLITVMPGSSLRQVTDSLNQQGLLSFPDALAIWARYKGLAGSIKTGEYELVPGLSPEGLLALLVSGRNKQYPLTVVEGWTFRQALEALWASEKIDARLRDASDEEITAALGRNIPFLEGSIFPDTYFYTAGTTDIAILSRARQRLESILADEWQNRLGGLPYKNSHEALVMASVIEKESGVLAEKQRIAGVFIRRLETGMRLQSDPTVIYGAGADYTGVIRTSDLTSETPWNTYRISGLPPTPIALVSRTSIRASLQPEDGSYLYFVASGNGGHYFSTTLEEHNTAVQRYRNILSADSAGPAGPAGPAGSEPTTGANSNPPTQAR
mgnify:CR=1 FL=1|jgi:UPF0755 protein